MTAQRAFECISGGYGDIDQVLSVGNISHRQYRHWCAMNRKPLPSPTPGLALELKIECHDRPHHEICQVYHLTQHELRHCLYNNSFYEQCNKIELEVLQARAAGATELDITIQFGKEYTDPELLRDEINDKIAAGALQYVLATEYNLTPGRISQLNNNARARPTLTAEQKADIRARRNEDARDLAKEFGVTRNTIYVVWRS